MPRHVEQQISPYSPAQLFALVADVEKYPQFLPWCRAARIISKTSNVVIPAQAGILTNEKKDSHLRGNDNTEEKNEFLAELIIAFAHISESYVSRVVLQSNSAIEVKMVRGPFEYLSNDWKFTEIEGGTRIDFALDFKFKSKILEKLIGGLFSKATEKMVSAFKTRADALYGQKINP